MCRKPAILVSLMMLSLTVTIPGALCAQPPPSPWSPPEEEWCPMSPDEAQPNMQMIRLYPTREELLSAGDPFCLYYRWGFLPTNVVYDYETGEPVEAYLNLQDRTDHAYCVYTVTKNGERLKPTKSLTMTCKWYLFWNSDTPRPEFPDGGYWAVAPRITLHYYYIEFPQGLDEGDYTIFLYGTQSGGEPWTATTTLRVS